MRRSKAGELHTKFALGAAAGAPDVPLPLKTNPAVSDRQRRYMGAALRRAREGHPRKGDPHMSQKKLAEFARR